MEAIGLEASPREVTGKKVKALRRAGFVPIHVYGKRTDPKVLQAETKALQKVIQRVGKNIPVSIVTNGRGRGKRDISFVREVQQHPVTGELLHVDFYQVDIAERMKAEVPVVLVGEAPAVRIGNGVLMQPFYTIEVEALPMEVPESFELDISGLDDFEKAIRVADVTVSEDVSILADPEDIVARVNPPRVEEERGEVEEGIGAGVEVVKASQGETAESSAEEAEDKGK